MMSISVAALTTQALIVVCVATVVLLIAAWRKPARAAPRAPSRPGRRPHQSYVVDHHDTPLYRRPSIVRRLFALIGSGAIGVLLGVLIAIVIGYGFAFAIIIMTDLLN